MAAFRRHPVLMDKLADHVRRTRAAWNGQAADDEQPGRRRGAQDEPTWGVWAVPESKLHLFAYRAPSRFM
jgi:hypothetical protein